MKTCLWDERGSGLAVAMMLMVVLALLVGGMLQVAAMSFRTGLFEEQRHQALCAAESGVNVAAAMLSLPGGVARASYPEDSASLNLDDILGAGMGCQVWVSEDEDECATVTSVGHSRGRTRVVEVQVASVARLEKIQSVVTALATDDKNVLVLHNSGQIIGDTDHLGSRGDVRINSMCASSIDIKNKASIDGILFVSQGTTSEEMADFESKLGKGNVLRATSSIKARLPLVQGGPFDSWPTGNVFTAGRYATSDWIIGKGKDGKSIKIDTSAGDVIIVVDSMEMKNSAKIEVIGGSDHVARIYVRGRVDIKNSAELNKIGDPAKLIIYALGDEDLHLKHGSTTHAVLYAPRARVIIHNGTLIKGAIVAERLDGKNGGTIEWCEECRSVDLGFSEGPPTIVAGSWMERRP